MVRWLNRSFEPRGPKAWVVTDAFQGMCNGSEAGIYRLDASSY